MTEKKGGFVFYPREYSINSSEHTEHYAQGVDQNGIQCVVYIHPPEHFLRNAKNASTAQSVPSLAQFSETHRRAQNPCEAHPENAPGNESGVLLIEQLSEAPENLASLHDMPVYLGKWASILSEGSYMPAPLVGKGYLELNFHNKDGEVSEFHRKAWVMLKKGLEAGEIPANKIHETIDTMDQHYNSYIENQMKWFVGVVIQPELTEQLHEPSLASVKESLIKLLSLDAPPGVYRGVMVRIRSGETVSYRSSCSVATQYNYKEKRPQTAEEAVSFFLREYSKHIGSALQRGNTVEFIPTLRVNCGKQGNEKYAKEIGLMGKIQKCYIDKRFHNTPGNLAKKNNGFLFADIAIRLAEINSNNATKGNLLLSSIHAFSAPQGNAMSISSAGLPEYKMNFKPIVDHHKKTVEESPSP
jgi:hypothetical protein